MQIRILDEIWNVYFVPPYSHRLQMENGDYTIGTCNGLTNCIYISYAISGELLQDCLQHEIAHAYHFASGFGMDLNNEEKMCQFVGYYSDEISETANEILGIHSNRSFVNYE